MQKLGDREQIWLEAMNPARNVACRYAIAVSRDLFGVMMVELSWGRIGSRGQAKTVSFADAAEADKFVDTVLRRRAGAVTRIGVAYCETGLVS